MARAIRHLPALPKLLSDGRSFVILLSLFFLLSPTTSFAQSSNRWLLIFNTSSAMRDRVDGMKTLTQDLLMTAMHGNLRRGDAVGIWTYDSELRSDEAPLITWNPVSASDITEHARGFLSRHPYAKTATAFGDVLTNTLRVIKNSDVITVILVSDGSDSVQGTPFDSELNAFYKTNYKDQKKAHMPVVTVFRGMHGTITAHTENLSPWPAEIPAVPPPAIVKAPAPPPPEPKPVVKYGEPLIIIGKKPEPVPTPAPAEANPATNSVTTVQKPAASETVTGPKIAPEEKSNETVMAAASTAPATNTTETWAKTAASSPSPEVETGASVPPQSLFSARNLAIVSVTFTVIVCGFLILAARRARRQSQSSLITRSLDREDR